MKEFQGMYIMLAVCFKTLNLQVGWAGMSAIVNTTKTTAYPQVT